MFAKAMLLGLLTYDKTVRLMSVTKGKHGTEKAAWNVFNCTDASIDIVEVCVDRM